MVDKMCKAFISVFLCCLCYLVTSMGAEFLNLADTYRGSVYQSSTYRDYVAENAVDGNNDQNLYNGHCSSTTWDKTVWWRIQFKGRVFIQRIIIYYRNDGQYALKRFEGSKVYISDVSDCDDQLVFTQQTDPTNPLTDTFNITGGKVGMYLSVCNNYYYDTCMQLCEVLVIGCPYGKYGDQCALPCGNCHQSTCDLYSGTCPGDCENMYMGPMCNISCIDRCQDSTCSKGGCTGCVVGKHGVYCDQQCPLNCRNNTCTEDDAVCTECQKNKVLNENCSNACSSNCNDKMCVQENGVCYSCTDGYWGSLCYEICPKDCKSNICNQTNGYCTVSCNKGFWGDNCNHTCPVYCFQSVCSHDSGICEHGCIAGHRGQNCNHTCPVYCFQSVCSQDSGICEHGCIAGHRGQNCTEDFKMEATQSQASEWEFTEEENYASIAGGVAGLIVIAAVAVAIIVFVKRRRNSQPKHTATSTIKNQTPFTSVAEDKTPTGDKCCDEAELKPRHNHNAATEAVYMNTGTRDNDHNEYYNTAETSSGILVDDLKEYIKAQSEDEFQSIFSKIVYGPQFEHDVGQRKENNSKNRFIAIFPYDHSRVKLQKLTAEHNSDYINANYIDSLDSERVYIAAQGPKQNTIEDTWRMIVQEKSGKIVMLTNLIEDKKKKCERYWPLAGEKMKLPGITLTLVSEEVRPFYIIRNINLSVKQKEQIETTQVTQFHFTSWPDHGVANPRQLVVFHRRVVHTKTSLPGPLIVHCSAGIGRTGTYIGLDALDTYGRLNKLVDVSGYVEKMRRNRMNMVQTAEQLQLLHEALYEALMYPGSAMFRNDFLKRYEHVRRRLSKEYQILQAMLPEYPPDQYSDATMEENKDKNRSQSVIPPNKYRPYLRTFVLGTTDYINAVIISGSVDNSEFLVTQLPLANTVIDFWRMVYDNDSNVVVLLNPLDRKQIYPSVLPSEGVIIKAGRLEMKLVSKETISSNITQSVVNISQKNCKEKRDVKVLHTTSWSVSEELPPSKQLILDLVESVTRWQYEKGGGPITVQCMDGVTCSGLYCAVSKVIQQIKIDQEVDVFQAVREMQICRPQFIQSEVQYRFCYEIAMDYLSKSEADVYVNADYMA